MTSTQFLALLLGLLCCDAALIEAKDLNRISKCEKITIPMCEDMPYNMTRMPNLMNHVTQAEAAISVHEFVPLVEINCSKHLKFFLCSLYAPMCTEQVDVPIPSCQSICEKVKEGCLPFLKQFNFDWPETLNCSRLPVPDKGLCMESPDVTKDREEKVYTDKKVSKTGTIPRLNNFRNPTISPYKFLEPPRFLHNFPSYDHGSILDRDSVIPIFRVEMTTEAPPKCPINHVFIDQNNANRGTECAVKCGSDFLFTNENKFFAKVWMGVWAGACLLGTIITMLTFFIDPSRFKYPERPIIFLSMSFILQSTGYLIRVFMGNDIMCDSGAAKESYIIVEGTQSTNCIVVFVILYYFGTASCMWWIILNITWYLAAGKKWGHEAIESLATYFHMFAWSVPAIKTIVVLTLHRIDGDELTGLCYVGNQNLESLLFFVIIPFCVYFLIGGLFLISGIIAMCRIRKIMRQRPSTVTLNSAGKCLDGYGVAKFEKLMKRIAIFSVCYAVPAIIVIYCQIFEYLNKERWKAQGLERLEKCVQSSKGQCELQRSIGLTEIFLLKIVMSMFGGLSTAAWIWSSKTTSSWNIFCRRMWIRHFGKNPSTQGMLSKKGYSVPPRNVRSNKRHHNEVSAV